MSKETNQPRTRSEIRESTRPQRVPMHEQQRNVLTTNTRPGYVRRWVNDVQDRVDRFMQAGWTLVEGAVKVGDTPADNLNSSLGTGARRPVGAGTVAVLMEIPEDLYAADQAAKQADISSKEEEMYRRLNSGADGTYGEVEIFRK